MRRLPRRPLLLLLLLATMACGGAGDSSAGATSGAVAASQGAGGGTAQTQRGEFVDGDERSTWMRTVRPDGTTSIEDDARFGEDGQANRVFTFDTTGALLRATEQRSQTAQGTGNSSPAMIRTELIIDFSGATPVATKMVDDVRRPVEPFEIERLRLRADALQQQARRAAPR